MQICSLPQVLAVEVKVQGHICPTLFNLYKLFYNNT